MDPQRNPRVFIYENTLFGDVPLAKIVEDAGCDLAWEIDGRDLVSALEGTPPPLDLIVLVLRPGYEALESVAELRKRDWLAKVPILVVSSIDGADLDLWQLRALGIVGLIDRSAPPEHVRFRVSQVAYKGRDGRRFERAPCCIPVEVDVEGKRITGYATSLSAGGIGLASSLSIEPNTLVGLRFSLDEGEEPISISGRTVHVREVERDGAEYQVGIFFHRLNEKLHRDISLAVFRLLAAWDAIGGSDLTREGAPCDVVESGAR